MPHVCMVIEGAYPYITGGVSAWCHQLIEEIPDVDFSLLVILPASYRDKDYKYKLPGNVISVNQIWLDKNYFPEKSELSDKQGKRYLLNEIINFHVSMKLKNYGFFKIITEMLSNVENPLSLEDLTKSREAVETLFKIYKETGNTTGFMRYFWTWKSTHLPLLRILNYPLPKADMYHAVSTGFAGVVSALAKLKHDIPFVLT